MTSQENLDQKGPPKESKSGWLKNKERLQRRDSAFTLPDKEALALIQQIGSMPNYTKLSKEADRLVRLRDQAIIAVEQTWFKRGGEGLSVKLSDVGYTNKEVVVTFTIEKKNKAYKICPGCEQKNAKSANYCKKCGVNIAALEPIRKSRKPVRKTKTKSRNYLFMPHVINWLVEIEQLEVVRNSWLFPRYHYFSRRFLWDAEKYSHLTVERFNQILQRLDITLTSCLFRYAGAENNLRRGYTPTDLKEIGDWSSSRMPEIYADRKGLTPTQKRFSKDIRTT